MGCAAQSSIRTQAATLNFRRDCKGRARYPGREVAGLCLDTGHLYYSHMHPVEYLKKYADKLDYVHFKDVNETVYRQGARRAHPLLRRLRQRGAMCPIGTGSLDYPAIKQALSDIGYAGYITIEQERDPRNSDTSLRDVKALIISSRSATRFNKNMI